MVINRNNEILLAKSQQKGWDIPGGQVIVGESIREAAIREVKGLTGIDIQLIKLCGIFHNVTEGICHTLFIGKPKGGKLTSPDENLDVDFFPIETSLRLVTWKNSRTRILYCLNEKKHPFYVEY
jgi:ADP-ribose pyrophosphatase YjhB (NUDIX family)